MENEVWTHLPHPYQEKYLISNMGRIASRHRYKHRLLKPSLNKKRGYIYVCCQVKNKRRNFLLHRLVAEAFVGRQDPSFNHVDHIDFDRTNNKASNLQWCTQEFNQRKSYLAGRMKGTKGEESGMAILNEKKVKRIREMASSGFKHREISKKFHIATCTATQIINRQRWAHI